MDEFTETSTEIGRRAGVTGVTVTKYSRLGLLEFRQASDGTRLYRASEADLVKRIYARRMANMGRKAS